jgi:hypothetical protein
MPIVIIIELRTIVSSISNFHPQLIPMFFHIYSIREFRNYVQSWNFTSIVIYFIGVRGGKNNKGDKQLMIVDGREFDQDVRAMGNNFKLEYEQLLEAYNGGQCTMVLIKNVVATSKRD